MSERVGASETTFWDEADDTEALQRYRTLVNAIDDGIYQLDDEGRFVAVNDVIAELSGYSREELRGEHVSLLLDADDVAAIEREIRRRLSGGDDRRDTFEFAVRTADGDRMPCELRLNLLVENGAFRGTIGVVRDVSDRKRAERTITERDRQLARESGLTNRILETSPVGILVLDGDGEVMRINERAGEILDISEREREAYDPGDRPAFDENGNPVPTDEHPFARALETGEPVRDRVLQVERPDGTRRWLSVSAAPILTDDGEVDHVVTAGEDITAIKERERELENELSEIFGRVADAFYALDDRWRITYANERAEELIDYTGDGLVGEDFWEVFEWATDSKLGAEYRTAMETQTPTSFEFYYPEPLEAWYEVHVYPSETGLSVYFQDVTERKHRERALEESERRYRTLVEHFPNGAVALVDENLRYRTVGGEPLDVADATVDELENRPVRDVLPPELADELVPRYEAALDGEAGTFEAESDGRIFQFQTVPVRDDDGTVFAALGMSQDVTAHRENQRKLAESERRYRTLVEHFPNGAVGLFDEDLRYTAVGGKAFDDFADSATDVVDQTVWDRYPEELAAQLEPKFRAAIDGESNAFEFDYHGRHWLAYTVPIGDEGDVFAGMMMVQDVTERTEYERRLAESERRYRTLAEYFPNGVVTLFDHDLEYTLAAGRGFDDIPVEPEEVEGESFEAVWGEETAAALEPVLEAALDGEERSVEVAYAGREWVVHAVPITDDRGDVFAGMTMAQDITEQKERERYLRDAKSQLEAATEAGAVGTWEWYIPEDEFVTGASFARTFGVDPDAAREGVPLDRVVSAVHEDDRDRVERRIEAAMESGGEYEEEYRVWNADGELRWVVARGHVECDEDGNPVKFPGALTDITERKRAEQALEEHRKQLETLFEVLPVGVVVADADGTFIEANEAAKDVWGSDVFDAESVEEYAQYPGWWADTGEPVEPSEWTIARVLRGEEVTEADVYEIETPDGERRIVMVHGMPVREASGEVTRGVVTLTDITDRREYQRQLEESERRYRTLAEHFPNGAVGVYDHDLRYTLTRGAVLGDELPGKDALEGSTMPEAFPDDTVADFEPAFRAAVEDGEIGSTTTEFGGRNWRLWAAPLRDADGDVFAGMSFIQDITEQVERERKLEETVEKLEESNDRLESFASMLAHELRNPVTIGQIYGQQLSADADPDAVEYVTEAFDRIEDMIDVMLVLTRGREAVGESSPLALADVAREAWSEVDAPDATLTVELDDVMQADETYVRHLFRNLFENAVQHGDPDATVRVGALSDGFYVADDGAGIPPDEREKVFETGFTTAAGNGGTGLGLAFVEELAEVYEWDCAVTESASGGARFEFRNVEFVSEE